MTRPGAHEKRIYDETASLITRQALMDKLDTVELHFLLHLLDSVVIKKQYRSFLDTLHLWKERYDNREVNQAVKSILLNTDLNDEQAINQSIAFIEEVLGAAEVKSITKEEADDERLLDL